MNGNVSRSDYKLRFLNRTSQKLRVQSAGSTKLSGLAERVGLSCWNKGSRRSSLNSDRTFANDKPLSISRKVKI